MGPAILFYSPEENPHLPAYTQMLANYGFRLCHCPDTASLRHALRRELSSSRRTAEPVMAVLAASAPLNRSAVSILTAAPDVGVLAYVDGCDDATLAETLQLGVDAWCPRDCSAVVLALTLHGLKRRMERGVSRAVGSPQGDGGTSDTHAVDKVWALRDQGWALETPDGVSVRLTSSERQFVMALAMQSDKSASHAQLLRALGRKVSDDHRILGVLVSRLRRKVAQFEEELPIKSIYDRGYMFAAQITV